MYNPPGTNTKSAWSAAEADAVVKRDPADTPTNEGSGASNRSMAYLAGLWQLGNSWHQHLLLASQRPAKTPSRGCCGGQAQQLLPWSGSARVHGLWRPGQQRGLPRLQNEGVGPKDSWRVPEAWLVVICCRQTEWRGLQLRRVASVASSRKLQVCNAHQHLRGTCDVEGTMRSRVGGFLGR